MKFLVDENTGIKVSHFLSEQGYDSVSATEKFLGFTDKVILKKAEQEKRIVITNDKDFGDLIFYHGLNSRGVVLLRLVDESVQNKIKIIKILLEKHQDKIKGNFVVVSENNIRVRKL
ncbi:hypothetical protein A3F08_00170 [Candidatus Berkelbacteria bacterium RIFCSPHIGHO2_12_FULL_36_9]|uniref:DUF5615 domain-containing protein n=1 Tax=Candidatus Berkelbacteria bacterium RIFCSPHIGHO2_12_FULL_36_9 TaxID=1797469 RepID=A0A1F5EHZ2_9BACT|nr:MAG: hypothetical protein A3F08_00170 [Candidatus Berkelbacteria bacterium RIFCSPHIGHO2_12_FULL_36_9]